MRRLIVMADYECYPLWETDEAGTRNVDPTTLAIPDSLARGLMAWADRYDSTLDRADPAASGFATHDDEVDFIAMGRRLADELATHLPGDHIAYGQEA